jgi:hypothetical protein
VHKITNCFLALNFLQGRGVKGLTISAEDLVDASEANESSVNLILGFCWMLLRQFQTTPDMGDNEGGSKENSFEMRMLEWCRYMLSGYDDISITGWDSFQDGKALLGLVEQFDTKLLNYKGLDKSDPMNNAKTALRIAEERINIPSELIDPEDLITGQISDKNLVLYLTLFYNAFSDKDSLTSRESLVARLHSLEEDIDTVLSQRETLERTKDILEYTRTELTDNLSVLTSERDELLKWKNINLAEWEEERHRLMNKIKELQENINMLKTASGESSSKLQSVNAKIRGECDDLQNKKANLTEKKKSIKRTNKYSQQELQQREKGKRRNGRRCRKYAKRIRNQSP